MDPADFDRLVARASDPHLIPGIYNYCDGRCPRCPFTERCLTYLDNCDLDSAGHASSMADEVGASLQRTPRILTEVARRKGIDLDAFAQPDEADCVGNERDHHQEDSLVVRARQYGRLAWRVARALAPVVARRGDEAVTGAVDSIEWFSSMISSKIHRAISGRAGGRKENDDDVQTDFNGSAKIALIGIAESRAAWAVLMEAGKATADGVPAQAVCMLDTLERDVRARFPRAEEFVRPGFDEPAIAAPRRF